MAVSGSWPVKRRRGSGWSMTTWAIWRIGTIHRGRCRAYGFDLLALCRWLVERCIELDAVTTDVLLDFLRACREATVPGRPSGNVVSMSVQPLDRYAAATINHRLAAVSGLFAFRQMRDPEAL